MTRRWVHRLGHVRILSLSKAVRCPLLHCLCRPGLRKAILLYSFGVRSLTVWVILTRATGANLFTFVGRWAGRSLPMWMPTFSAAPSREHLR